MRDLTDPVIREALQLRAESPDAIVNLVHRRAGEAVVMKGVGVAMTGAPAIDLLDRRARVQVEPPPQVVEVS